MTVGTRAETAQALRESLQGLLAATRRLRSREAQRPGELTFPHWRLLRALAESGEQTAGALAHAAEVAPATVTEMLDQLVERGIVERARSEHDRRRVLNRLTRKGRRVYRRKEAALDAKWQAALAELSDEELEHGARVVARLRGFLDDL